MTELITMYYNTELITDTKSNIVVAQVLQNLNRTALTRSTTISGKVDKIRQLNSGHSRGKSKCSSDYAIAAGLTFFNLMALDTKGWKASSCMKSDRKKFYNTSACTSSVVLRLVGNVS
jgi:hypothetical protein